MILSIYSLQGNRNYLPDVILTAKRPRYQKRFFGGRGYLQLIPHIHLIKSESYLVFVMMFIGSDKTPVTNDYFWMELYNRDRINHKHRQEVQL
jgi:hypothetical protein